MKPIKTTYFWIRISRSKRKYNRGLGIGTQAEGFTSQPISFLIEPGKDLVGYPTAYLFTAFEIKTLYLSQNDLCTRNLHIRWSFLYIQSLDLSIIYICWPSTQSNNVLVTINRHKWKQHTPFLSLTPDLPFFQPKDMEYLGLSSKKIKDHQGHSYENQTRPAG